MAIALFITAQMKVLIAPLAIRLFLKMEFQSNNFAFVSGLPERSEISDSVTV
jgi:hypothetical protein